MRKAKAMSVDLKLPVLIVYDYATMLRIVKNLLKQIGFDNVDEPRVGGAAFQMMKMTKCCLVSLTGTWFL